MGAPRMPGRVREPRRTAGTAPLPVPIALSPPGPSPPRGRFHRARNVSAHPGSGLGLAIVKAAVERCGGRVTFTSSEAGTKFRVTLPGV